MSYSALFRLPLYKAHTPVRILAAVLTAREIGINDKQIVAALKDSEPAFGRQEEIVYKTNTSSYF